MCYTISQICLTFSLCCHFVMLMRVTVQKATPLQLKVMGTVSFPVLRLVPRTIHLRGVGAFTFQHYLITATNGGTTKLKLNFLLEEYPEFRISRSNQRHEPDAGMHANYAYCSRMMACFANEQGTRPYLSHRVPAKNFICASCPRTWPATHFIYRW